MSPPTPTQVREARKEANLTQAQAAGVVGLGARQRWLEYELGKRQMPAYRFEMFLKVTAKEK